MEVATFIWKADLLVLTEKETDEIGTVGNQHVAAGDLLGAEEDVEHQGLVVNLTMLRNVDRVLDNAPVNPDSRYIFDLNLVIDEKATEMPPGFDRKGIVGDGKLQKAAILRILFEGKMPHMSRYHLPGARSGYYLLLLASIASHESEQWQKIDERKGVDDQSLE